jgi:hypothetical protein
MGCWNTLSASMYSLRTACSHAARAPDVQPVKVRGTASNARAASHCTAAILPHLTCAVQLGWGRGGRAQLSTGASRHLPSLIFGAGGSVCLWMLVGILGQDELHTRRREHAVRGTRWVSQDE